MKTLFLSFFLFLTPLCVFAQEQCDFDGDGTTDYTYVVNNAGNLIWSSRSSADNSIITSNTFGLATDLLTPARWLNSSKPSLGVVRQDTEKKNLIWKVLLDSGLLAEEIFGKTGSVFLSGGDFDGNGIADAVYVSQGSKGLKWRIRLNMFSNADKRTVKLRFGKNGDRVFYLNPTGEKDWVGTFGKGKKSNAVLTLRNLSTREKIVVKNINRSFLNGGNLRPRPFPIKSESGSDVIGFLAAPPSDPTDAKLTVYDLNGVLMQKVSFGGLGTFAVGEFDSNHPGEEIIFQGTSSMHIFNPFSGVDAKVTPFGSTIVDEINIENVNAPTAIPTATATTAPTLTPTVTPTVTRTPS